MEKSAVICASYRYVLRRIWDPALPLVNFVGLNPSTADAVDDDPTIRRCLGFARDWGMGGLLMTNLFAWRETKSKLLRTVAEPVGVFNDHYLRQAAAQSAKVLVAWGRIEKWALPRSRDVTQLLGSYELSMLGLTDKGEPRQPRHPLFVRAVTQPQPFQVLD